MAEGDKQQKKRLEGALGALGLQGDFLALVEAAVRGDWGVQKFVTRLVRTDAFQEKFPGLITPNGLINENILGQQGAVVNSTSLAQAVSHYNTMMDQYQNVSSRYGYKWNKEKMAAVLKSDTSIDEFGSKLAAIDTVQANKETFDAWKRQAKMAGIKDFNAFKLAQKLNDNKFFNTLEAAQLKTQVGLTNKQAARTAKQIGPTGAYDQNSLNQTISYVRQNLAQVGPELQRQGINAAKLVKVIGNPGAFAKEMDLIRQTVDAREGLSRPVAGSYGQKGSAGGLSLYEEDQSAAYG